MNTAALKSCTEVIKMFERSSEELMNQLKVMKDATTKSS